MSGGSFRGDGATFAGGDVDLCDAHHRTVDFEISGLLTATNAVMGAGGGGVTDTARLRPSGVPDPAFDPFVMAITSPHPAFRQIAATATE
jgi:hypothetical protein